MNEANKNEVDLLLRSLARGRKNAALQSGLASGDETAVVSDHLDADELNSYAEGVVPDPARVRYTEHLADCAICRSLVVGLTQAAGATRRHEVAEQKNESSLWQQLAALLSPSVLRYAVPVLVLTIVIGIGLFALRQKRENAFVAENRSQNDQPALSDSGAVLNPASEPSATVQTAAAARTEDTSEDQSKMKDKKLQAGQTLSDSDSSLAKAAPAKAFKDAEEAGAGTGAGEVAGMRPGAAQPRAAEPPPALEAEKSANYATDGPAKREDKERSRDEYRNQSDDVHGPNRGRNNAPMSTTQRAVGGLTSERGPRAMNNNNIRNNEVETRDVLGKRFTRNGSVWVDTDYASQATTKISRGSEQYRALVADEPGIRTIAERLDGAIIVVWRGRAYRIQ
jgi:hypothetical protein